MISYRSLDSNHTMYKEARLADANKHWKKESDALEGSEVLEASERGAVRAAV